MAQGKPAVLILKKPDSTRVFVCDNHNHALDVAERYEQVGYGWQLLSFEHLPTGEFPEDCPPLQKRMKLE